MTGWPSSSPSPLPQSALYILPQFQGLLAYIWGTRAGSGSWWGSLGVRQGCVLGCGFVSGRVRMGFGRVRMGFGLG